MMPAVVSEQPPAAPGPGQQEWRCGCGRLLGVVYERWVYIRHRGRIITACLPARVQCEDCGRKNVQAG